MQTVQPTAVRPHIVWLDVLRLIAILLVIAVHCTDPFNASPESRADPEFNLPYIVPTRLMLRPSRVPIRSLTSGVRSTAPRCAPVCRCL